MGRKESNQTNKHIWKKVHFDQLLDFRILLLLFLHTLLLCHFNLTMLGFFNNILVSNSLDPDQAQHFVGPDLSPNCLQRLSADIAGKKLTTNNLLILSG